MNPCPTTVAVYMFSILFLGIHPETLIYRLLPLLGVGVLQALSTPPPLYFYASRPGRRRALSLPVFDSPLMIIGCFRPVGSAA